MLTMSLVFQICVIKFFSPSLSLIQLPKYSVIALRSFVTSVKKEMFRLWGHLNYITSPITTLFLTPNVVIVNFPIKANDEKII